MVSNVLMVGEVSLIVYLLFVGEEPQEATPWLLAHQYELRGFPKPQPFTFIFSRSLSISTVGNALGLE